MTRFKILFIGSLTINAIAFTFVIRRLYYMHEDYKSAHPIVNTTVRNEIYNLFPIDSADIIFLGDSQMELFDTPEFFPSLRIKNRGISGDDTGEALNRIDKIIAGHPLKIFIELGTNDIYKEINSVSEALSNIQKIVSKIKAGSPQTNIYIQSTFPLGKSLKAEAAHYNNKLQDICKKNNCTYIETYNDFSNNGDLKSIYNSGDGLHLSANGYIKWASILKPYLH